MLSFIFGPRDTGAMPKANALSDRWHAPQFSKIYDSRVRQTRVAMLITSPDAFYAEEVPHSEELDRLSQELHRYAHSKWASLEARKAAAFFRADEVTSFVAILEHAASGAYATRAQRLKAYYHFDGSRIGDVIPRGWQFDEGTVDQCVTV